MKQGRVTFILALCLVGLCALSSGGVIAINPPFVEGDVVEVRNDQATIRFAPFGANEEKWGVEKPLFTLEKEVEVKITSGGDLDRAFFHSWFPFEWWCRIEHGNHLGWTECRNLSR